MNLPSRPITKPFSNASNRPAVSPYMNLLREDAFGADDDIDYYGIVKPHVDQLRTNQRVQQQGQQVYQQLQALQSRAAFPTQGSENLLPTGHQTVFLNYLHYYAFPQAGR